MNKAKPLSRKDLLKIKTNSLASTEMKMLEYVADKNIVDLTKLPPASFVREQYAKDSKIDERTIKEVAYWYEKKIELFRSIQLGRDPFKTQYYIPDKNDDKEKFLVDGTEHELTFAQLEENILNGNDIRVIAKTDNHMDRDISISER